MELSNRECEKIKKEFASFVSEHESILKLMDDQDKVNYKQLNDQMKALYDNLKNFIRDYFPYKIKEVFKELIETDKFDQLVTKWQNEIKKNSEKILKDSGTAFEQLIVDKGNDYWDEFLEEQFSEFFVNEDNDCICVLVTIKSKSLPSSVHCGIFYDLDDLEFHLGVGKSGDTKVEDLIFDSLKEYGNDVMDKDLKKLL